MKTLSYTAIALFMFFTSCKDNETISFSGDDNSNLQSEASSDAQLEDMADLSGVAVSADAGTLTGSRSNPSSRIIDLAGDARFSCAEVTLEFANDNVPGVGAAANPHGFITIDFGTGCTGPNGRVRKGKIIIEFQGRRFVPGSTVIIGTDGYSVDGIGIEGTRTELNASASTEDAPSFTISEDVTITFLDGSTATRSATRTRTWTRASNPLNDTWTVTGIASGTTRKGKEYAMTITKPLVFKRSCAIESKMVMPVEGTKELVANDKKITIDFGDGTCDTKVTITVNGRSKEIEVSANGD
jgi:hypothetical protein